MAEIRERIMQRVRKRGGCWEWTGATSKFGHGRMKVAGRLESPHRLMWEEENGPIPRGLWVLHTCDNPRCVRPSHLFIGNRRDNMRDASKKGRLHVEHPNKQTKVRGDGKVWCNRCKRWLHASRFGKDKDPRPQGWRYKTYCKKCYSERQSERYYKNKGV